MAKQVTKSIIVKTDAATAFDLWADFENFPEFMTYIKSVRPIGPNTSHWVLAGPAGSQIDWTAEQTRFEVNKRIAWNTKDNNGLVTTSGQVTFNQLDGEQTEVTVMMQYSPPAGKLGEWVAELFARPGDRLVKDLRQFKARAEARTQATA